MQDDPLATLFDLTGQMAAQGIPLIPRIVPPGAEFRQWDHYPDGDAISPTTGCRWFYHAHPPDQRAEGEHGHLHLFFPLSAFGGVAPLAAPTGKNAKGKKPAKVVHIIALSFDLSGLPIQWFATNRWVTNEYIMPSDAVIERLPDYDVCDAPGDPLVNGWITAAVAGFREQIAELIRNRDAALDGNFEDKSIEIASSAPFDL